MRDYIGIASQYIDDILAGNIPACKHVKSACERQKNDLDKPGFKYKFSEQRAVHVCLFIEKLPHVKGKWAKERRLIELEPWQIFILTTCFGWIDDKGYRRYKTAYCEIPRKNAKSTLAAGIALYCLVADEEEGAEVYSAATDGKQAKIVWAVAKQMVDKTPGLQWRYGVETSSNSVFVQQTGSLFTTVSRDRGGNNDGYSVSCAIIDELHGHDNRKIYDVIETGTGSREQPFLLSITTAGSNRAGICYEQRIYVTKILDGREVDEEYFGIIFTIDEEDDWKDPEIWIKANPNWGVSVKPEDIQRKARKALATPSARNNFKTKHLDVWVNADVEWLDIQLWDRLADESLKEEDFADEECELALDLASKKDIAAKIKLFDREGEKYLFCKFYLPEKTIETSDNSQYSGWVEEGWITTTPGVRIDYNYIKDDMREDAILHDTLSCSYDPFHATQLVTEMMDEGFEMIEVRPTTLNFSEAMKEVEVLILDGKLHHDGNPVMSWMMSNVVGHYDKKDNIYPNKPSGEKKIDGPIALMMAIKRMMDTTDKDSRYEEKGIRTL